MTLGVAHEDDNTQHKSFIQETLRISMDAEHPIPVPVPGPGPHCGALVCTILVGLRPRVSVGSHALVAPCILMDRNRGSLAVSTQGPCVPWKLPTLEVKARTPLPTWLQRALPPMKSIPRTPCDPGATPGIVAATVAASKLAYSFATLGSKFRVAATEALAQLRSTLSPRDQGSEPDPEPGQDQDHARLRVFLSFSTSTVTGSASSVDVDKGTLALSLVPATGPGTAAIEVRPTPAVSCTPELAAQLTMASHTLLQQGIVEVTPLLSSTCFPGLHAHVLDLGRAVHTACVSETKGASPPTLCNFTHLGDVMGAVSSLWSVVTQVRDATTATLQAGVDRGAFSFQGVPQGLVPLCGGPPQSFSPCALQNTAVAFTPGTLGLSEDLIEPLVAATATATATVDWAGCAKVGRRAAAARPLPVAPRFREGVEIPRPVSKPVTGPVAPPGRPLPCEPALIKAVPTKRSLNLVYDVPQGARKRAGPTTHVSLLC